jgi:hypothetical protein
LVYEDGKIAGKNRLRRILVRDEFQEPIFEPKSDTIKNGFLIKGAIPLQAGDFIAYSAFSVGRKIESGGFIEEVSWMHDLFRQIPGEVRYFGVNGMSQLRERMKNVID